MENEIKVLQDQNCDVHEVEGECNKSLSESVILKKKRFNTAKI